MGISPIGFTNHSISNVNTASSIQPQKTVKSMESDSMPSVTGDKVDLECGSEVPKKKGFIAWLKDLVKTEVDGPTESYLDRTCRVMDEIMANAQPGDIPATMPQRTKNVGEPTEYYIPGCGSHTGMSVSTPSESVPTRADVTDYKYISTGKATKLYAATGADEKLSSVQKNIIKQYCGQGFMAMNGHLIDGEDNATGTVDKAVRCAAGALDKFELPSGIILNRCASTSELLNYVSKEDYAKYKKFADKGKMEKLATLLDQRLTGTQTERKTFISTSVGKEANFLDRPKIVTKYYIGEGVKGLYVSASPDLAKFDGENEYLLAPNTPSTVMGVEYNPETKGLTMHVFLGDKPTNKA